MAATTHPGVAIGVALLAGGFALSASAQDPDDKACMACHESKSRPVDPRAVRSSVHAKLACAECHGDAEGERHPEKLKRVNCRACHAEPAKEFAKSIHAELAKKQVPDTPACASCHGTHDIFRKTDVRSHVNHLKVDATCLKCHAKSEITGRHPDMPPAEFAEKYTGSVHGRAVHLKGLIVAATCTDCHGHHEMRPKGDPNSSVHRKNVPNTCRTCHVGIFESWKESSHGKLWEGGKDQGPVCTTCHSAHEIKDPTTGPFRLRAPDNCGGCHKQEKGTYRDTFHGKATSLGMAVAATCSDCHTPHKNLPKSDPASTVHPSNLAKTCGRCHPGASANLIRYNPHLDLTNGKSKAAHYVHLGMILLLAGVFGFFGIHTFLWFQRSVVAMLRKEMPHENGSGKYVRRFPGIMIGLHVVIVSSFLFLVITGLPLRYHTSSWARPFALFLGGIETTRVIHRFSAILTFGYGLVHLGWLLHQFFVRRNFRLFWGADSLMPRWKDVVDLFHNLRWFLYFGKPPRYGRWTYFEKFDYFAVFWGVPIMGFSGLMMWFPAFFTKFLPGEVLNLATIVHSEESLLAGGFIFLFHFFHNHMRPENFPIDTSIFTGVIPLERFEKERPEQYQALVRTGRLEEILVPPPTKGQAMFGRIFGWTALSLGTAVAITVVVTYFVR
ncbi:MAG: hypothetical protein HYY17_08065 [Planctomycetes bacterium]|nr:hypothetical protein [Planctomycetota bacterium]